MQPQVRDDSFYPSSHYSHMRTDLFLLSTKETDKTMLGEYLPRNLSDHSLLTLSILMSGKTRSTYRLRLNPTLQKKQKQNTDCCKFIREYIKLFCKTNCDSSPNSFILWDTLEPIKGKKYFLHRRT